MIHVLMVCLGNICRSPLAEGILQSKLNSNHFNIDSAGTAAYHIGKSPDSRSIKVAKTHNIDISKQKARQFKTADFETFDYIFAMDQSNYENIISLARDKNDIEKVELLLNQNSKLKDVPDPYYGDYTEFEHVFDLINSATDVIASNLIKP